MTVSKGGRTNEFYFFGGKDESSQDLIQGITLAGVFFDEVALMPQSFVNQATAVALSLGQSSGSTATQAAHSTGFIWNGCASAVPAR